ncbi:hypothetical protein Rs2_42099 [Raphanus sativus]|nr:hypothetical protein Rs2_42099 [Raphanus sativus]
MGPSTMYNQSRHLGDIPRPPYAGSKGRPTPKNPIRLQKIKKSRSSVALKSEPQHPLLIQSGQGRNRESEKAHPGKSPSPKNQSISEEAICRGSPLTLKISLKDPDS